MMLDIFLPEKIKGTRLLSKRILSMGLNSKRASSVEIFAKRGQTIVESVGSEPIETGDEKTYTKRAASALKKIIDPRKQHDQIRVSIPAGHVVFKELNLPLKDIEKIRMVVEYEVESQLPFSIEESVIDFIITRQAQDEENTQILVAAIRKDDLQKLLNTYKLAGITPTHITIDLFALYDLYKLIPVYKNIIEGSSIVDVGNNTTRVAFIQNGELRLLRNIPQGISTIAKHISQETGMTEEEACKTLKEKGIQTGNKKYESAAQKYIISYLNDIQFTLNSFSLKLGFYKDIKKILFTRFEAGNDFTSFASDVLQTPAEIFNAEKIFAENVVNKVMQPVDNWNKYTTTLGTALSATMDEEFDLRKKEFSLPNMPLMRKQVSAAIILILGALIGIGSFGYMELSNLSQISKNLETKESIKLKKLLSIGKKMTEDDLTRRLIIKALKETRFSGLLKKTSIIVDSERRAWLDLENLKVDALSSLHALIQSIDKKSFNASIDSVSISTEAGGTTKVEATGLLKPKQVGEEFREWAKFKQKISEESPQKGLTPISFDEALGIDEGGVKFTLTFQTKKEM